MIDAALAKRFSAEGGAFAVSKGLSVVEAVDSLAIEGPGEAYVRRERRDF